MLVFGLVFGGLGFICFFALKSHCGLLIFPGGTVLHAIAESTVLACIKRHKVYHNKSSRGKN